MAGGYHLGQLKSSISPDVIKASKAVLWLELVLEGTRGQPHKAAGGSGRIPEGLVCSSGSPFDRLPGRRCAGFPSQPAPPTPTPTPSLWLLPACPPRSGNARSRQGRGRSPLKLPGRQEVARIALRTPPGQHPELTVEVAVTQQPSHACHGTAQAALGGSEQPARK